MENYVYMQGYHAGSSGQTAYDCPYTMILDARRIDWLRGLADGRIGAPIAINR